MKPRIIKLAGSSSPITVIAEVFDDKFSNANCSGDEGVEYLSAEGYSNAGGYGWWCSKKCAARNAAAGVPKLTGGEIAAGVLTGGASLILHSLKARKIRKAAAAQAAQGAATPDCSTSSQSTDPTQPCYVAPQSTDPNAPGYVAPQSSDPNAPGYIAGPVGDTSGGGNGGGRADDGSQDATDAINDRDQNLPDDMGDDGSSGQSDDTGGVGDDGMDNNEAMGQDGDDGSNQPTTRRSNTRVTQSQDDGSTSDESGSPDEGGSTELGDTSGEMDQDNTQDTGSADLGDTQDTGDISEGEDFFEGRSNATGVSKKKLASVKKIYLKKGAGKLLAMAKSAGVTPPSLGGDPSVWANWTRGALKKIPTPKVILKALKKKSRFEGEGKVMIEMGFDGDMSFTPMGQDQDIHLFSTPVSNADGDIIDVPSGKGVQRISNKRKYIQRPGKRFINTPNGKRKIVRTTGVPKDNLRTPMVVKKGNVTVVHNALKPKISKNYIDIPASSSFQGNDRQTGLIGLDADNDYDAPRTEYIFMGADGKDQKKSNMVPLLAIGLLALGIGVFVYGTHKVLKG